MALSAAAAGASAVAATASIVFELAQFFFSIFTAAIDFGHNTFRRSGSCGGGGRMMILVVLIERKGDGFVLAIMR